MIKLYNEDCLTGMAKLSAESIDLVVTSPPYDNLRKYNGPSQFDFEGVAAELWRVIKPGGGVVWMVGDQTVNGSKTGTSFRQALYFKEIGFNLHDTMIYQKAGVSFPPNPPIRYASVFEYMFVLSKGRPSTVNLLRDRKTSRSGEMPSGTQRDHDGKMRLKISVRGGTAKPTPEYSLRYNIWQYVTGYGNSAEPKIAFEHSAIFPLKLEEDHVKSWSNEGNLVLDCFAGSGTTAVACLNLNRRFIGFEINERYCDIAQTRISEALAKKQQELF